MLGIEGEKERLEEREKLNFFFAQVLFIILILLIGFLLFVLHISCSATFQCCLNVQSRRGDGLRFKPLPRERNTNGHQQQEILKTCKCPRAKGGSLVLCPSPFLAGRQGERMQFSRWPRFLLKGQKWRILGARW